VAAQRAPTLQCARAQVGLKSPSQRQFDRIFLQKLELDEIFSKNESYSVKYPLQLLQRSSYVFLNGLRKNVKQSLGFAERR
jgi:DNA-binding PucR family transcriptional regulator